MVTQVSTSEYRAQLKLWHDRVRAGEDIVVTDNGDPRVLVTTASSEGVLDELEQAGLLRRARPRRPAALIDWVPAPGDSIEAVSRARDR